MIKQIKFIANGSANMNGHNVAVDNGTPSACVRRLPEIN